MRYKLDLTIVLSTLLVFFFCAYSQAAVYHVGFNAWTTNYTDHQDIGFWIEVADTELRHPPDAITSITVTAPDNTVFDLTVDNWLPFDQAFSRGVSAADFDSEVIPSGRYVATVVDTLGRTIRERDDVSNVHPLDLPVVTSPVEGSTVGRRPRIRWTRVPGAGIYRILLWNETRNEPVYWSWRPKVLWLDVRSFRIPLGELKPNCDYSLRVEARDALSDTDRRSRSGWVHFRTRSW